MWGRRALGFGLSALVLALFALSLDAAQFVQPGASEPPVSFRLIIVSSADKAAQLLEQVKAGGDFAKLAQAESLDPSAARGGLIGPIALSELRGDLQKALRALPVGGVSGVLQLPPGFAIVQRAESSTTSGSRIRGNEVLAVSSVSSIKSTLSVDGFSEAA